MKKKLPIIIGIIFLLGLTIVILRLTIFKDVTTIINLANNLTFDYAQDVYLLDTISIIDGQILDQNYLIDTNDIGTKEIEIKYKDSNGWKKKYKYSYEVVDREKPYLSVKSNLYLPINNNVEDVLNGLFCGDNYDRDVKLSIDGEYDTTTVGNYNVKVVASDISNNITEKETTLHIYEPQPSTNNNSSNKEKIEGTPLSYYIKNFKTENNSFGIDISSYQTIDDFNKLKEQGIDFVILRIGYGPIFEDYSIKDDIKFEDFYNRAKEAGLKIGAYMFSYAGSNEDVDYISNYVYDKLKDKEIDLFVAYDWENWKYFRDYHINFVDFNRFAQRFIENMNSHGYKGAMYGSKHYLENFFFLEKYPIWLAQYNDEVTYSKKFDMWQISESCQIDGINGFVDLDILYNK